MKAAAQVPDDPQEGIAQGALIAQVQTHKMPVLMSASGNRRAHPRSNSVSRLQRGAPCRRLTELARVL